MARFDPKSYAKNVLRSAGYITAESIKGVNPTLTSYITDTASSAREMYDFAKDFKRRSKEKIDENGNGILKELGKQKKNILDDIRSGKFYNPEREKSALDDYMKREGFSFDDIDFDVDENFGEDSESSSSDASSKAIDNLSRTQQKLTAASTDEIVRSEKANARLTIKSTNKMFGMVNNSLSVINSSILALHQDLATPLNTHIINSSNFYQMATTEMAKQTSYLENINKILTERYETRKAGFGNKSNYKTSAWEDVFSSGLPNFKKWGQHAKANYMANSTLGMVGDMLTPDMLDMISGSGAISSPIAQLAILGLTSKLQGSKFGKSLNRTEDILKGGFAHLASRISAKAKSRSGFANKKDKYGESKVPFLDTILSALDISPKLNNKISHKYNRGPMDWDGESKKALTEVIPQLLAVIAHGVDPTWEPRVFNYKSGRFETARQSVLGLKKARKDAILAESSNLKSDITREYIDSYNARLKVGKAEMNYKSIGVVNLNKDFDTVIQELTLSGINPASLDDIAINRFLNDLANRGRISKSSATALKSAFKKNRMRLTSSIMNGRVANNKVMADAGETTFGQITNGSGIPRISNEMNKKGSYANTILSAKDDTGHDIYWYLQNFYSSFRAIEHNMTLKSFGSGNATDATYQQAGEFKTYKDFRVENAKNGFNAKAKNKINKINKNKRSASLTDEIDPITGEVKKSSFNKTERKEAEEGKTSVLTRVVDRVNDSLTKLFIGNTNIKQFIADGGILNAIKKLPDLIANAIQGIRDKAKDWIKDKWDKFRNSDGGKAYFGSLKDQFRGMGRSILDQGKQYAGEVVEWFSGNKPEWASGASAARGGFVTKSGMVSVSEGEMIIPSEANPFYKGRTNKSSQRARESMNYRNWVAAGGNKRAQYWGSFSTGTTYTGKWYDVVKSLVKDGKSKEEIKEYLDANFKTFRNNASIEKIENTIAKIKGETKAGLGKFANDIKNTKPGQIISNAGKKVDESLDIAFGSRYKDSKDIAKSAMDVIKKSLPQTMASGTIGAIIAGAMTGSGLGLLGGFAVGAGIHVLKNSDSISKKLFGEEDSNGNMTGGILPPKAATFLKKRVPSIAKSGALGTALGLTGLVPGGILGGFLVGAGVDILAHNKTIKSKITEAFFGHEGVDGKRRGGIIDSFKLRVIDPVADYVKGGLGKVTGYFKKHVLDNAAKIFTPLTDWVKGKGTRMLEGIGDFVKSKIDRVFGGIGRLFHNTFGRIFKGAFGLFKGGVSLGAKALGIPLDTVGNIGDALTKHNIKAGYSTKSAKERVELMGNKASGYDRLLAEVEDDPDKRKDLIQSVNFFSNTKKRGRAELAKSRQNLNNQIMASMSYGGLNDPKEAKRLEKLLRGATDRKTDHTDYTKVLSELDSFSGISDENKAKLRDEITRQQAIIQKREYALRHFDEEKTKFFNRDELKGLGVIDKNGNINNKKLAQISMQSTTDLRRLGLENLTKIDNEGIKKPEEILEDQKKNDPLGVERNSLLKDVYDLLLARNNHDNIPTEDKTSFDKAKEKTNIPSMDGSKASSDGPKEGDKRQNPNTGENEEFRGGKWVLDLSDQETKEAQKEKQEEKEQRGKLYNFFLGGGLLTGLGKIFGTLGKDGEKKQTIFDKIKGFLGGALGAAKNFLGGIFGPITSFFGSLGGVGLGSLIAEGVKAFISNGGLTTILAAYGINKVLDNAADKAAGTGYDSGMYKGADSEARKEEVKKAGWLERKKLGLDYLENKYWRHRDTTTYEKGEYVTEYESNRIGKRAIKNAISSFNPALSATTGVVLSKTVGKIPFVGKLATGVLDPVGSISRGVSAVGTKLLDIATDPALSGKGSQVAAEAVLNAIEKAKTKIAKVLGIAFNKITGKAITDVDDVAKQIATAFSNASNKFVNVLGKVAWFLYIAQIVAAVEDGLETAKAKTILGILDQPTMSQRLISAVINGINYAIPGIGGIIPSETIFNIIYTILSKIGIDFGNLAQQRAEAKATVEEYNKTNGKTYNIEEYIHNELGEYTTQEKIKKSIGGTVDKVKTTVGGVFNKAKSGLKSLGSSIKNTTTSAIGGIKNFGSAVKTKASGIVSGAKTLIQTAGSKLSKGKDYLKESVTAITGLAGAMDKVFANKNTSISDVINVKANIKENNPLYGITNTVANTSKLAIVPGLFVKYLGIKVKNKAEEIFSKIKDAVNPYIEIGKTAAGDVVSTVTSDIDSFKAGDIVGLWTNKSTISEDNPIGILSKVANFASSMQLTIPTLVSFVGHKAVDSIKTAGEFISKEAHNVAAIGKASSEYMTNGDIKGLWTSDNSNAGGEGNGFISKIANWGFRFGFTIPTVINAAGNAIKEIFDKAKKSIPDVKVIINKLWEYTDNSKDMGTFDSTADSFKVSDQSDVFATINNGIVGLIRGILKPVVTIARAVGYLGDKVKDVIDWGKDKWEGAKETVSGAWNSAKSWAGDKLTDAKNWLVGGDSGVHVTQKGSNRKFGHSTIDDIGCGPASAATVLRAYGRGGNLDDAAKYAEIGGYVAGSSGSGTRASYFSDILGANGIRTSYTNRQSDIRRAVGSGNPTILLGQDSRNRSKRNSPFGPNPHYVVARGSDSRGNVWIDDPELGAPALYNKNILNKTKLGVLTGGGSNAIQADDGAVWNYLKSAGLTDAGIAGLMGNLYAESGIKSNIIERDAINKYKNKYHITYDDASYTTAIDRGLQNNVKGGPNENLSPKQGIVSEYEFTHMPWETSNKKADGTYFGQNGYGLVQWTTAARKQGLYDLARSKGRSISDKAMQLEYLVYELQNKYPAVYNTLKNTNSLQEASNIVLEKFESPANWQSHSALRKSYGETYYSHFTTNPPTDTGFGNNAAQSINFPIYNLSEQQLRGVANILQNEQSGVQGRYAEASLMANLIDMTDDSKATAPNLESYLRKSDGWFAHGAERFEAGYNGSATIEPTALAAATDIFNNGKRTMPRYINEHDCFADLATVNGKSTGLSKAMGFNDRIKNTPDWVKDRSIYKAGTPIRNVYGSDWKFFMFPDAKADPFGYKSEEYRQKYGDAHYNIDEHGNVTAPGGYSTSGTGFSSGSTSGGTTSSGGTNLVSILSSTFSKIFQVIGSKLTGAAGAIFKIITGGFGNNTTENVSENYNNLTGSTGQAGFGSIGTTSVPATSGSMVNGFPYYMQNDSQWGQHPYGSHGTLSSSACGPTSMAMVMKSYGANVTPVETADWSAANGFRESNGTGWGYFKAIGNTIGLDVNQFQGDTGRVKQDLQNGIPVIGSMRPGNFTKGGHFIVFTGMDSRGNIYVNDPSSSVRTGHSWLPEQSLSQAKQFWEITKNGQGSLGRIVETDPSIEGSAGGRSGLPTWYYNFTGGKAGVSSSRLKELQDNYNQTIADAQRRNELKHNYNNYIEYMQYIRDSKRRRELNEEYNNYIAESQARIAAKNNNISSGVSNGTSGSNYSSSGIYSSASVSTGSGGIDTNTLNTIIEYLKTIADNSKYSASLPTIVELIGKLTGVTAAINSNSTSIANQDTANNINQDLSAIMQKLETIASTL